MLLLILGLVIFLGVNSIRIVADDWRTWKIRRIGSGPWKGIYSLASLVGFVLIIIDFGKARLMPALHYVPPDWLRHFNIVFTLVAFILVAAAYVPFNHLKEKIGHPMLAGTKLWAVGHLLAVGMLQDVILFGAILVWAIIDFAVSRRCDRAAGVVYPSGTVVGDIISVLVGSAT